MRTFEVLPLAAAAFFGLGFLVHASPLPQDQLVHLDDGCLGLDCPGEQSRPHLILCRR